MSELVPCPGCKRHVSTREVTCPFCARALSPSRAQRVVLIGRVSRAAVFSAALAACSDDKPKPAPPPAQGSDDLEKLLDHEPKQAEHPDVPPPADAAEPIAQTIDAGVDAGLPPDAGVARKKKKKQQIETITPPDLDRIQNAKPYGAPPARKRIV